MEAVKPKADRKAQNSLTYAHRQVVKTSAQPKENFVFMKLNVTKGWDGQSRGNGNLTPLPTKVKLIKKNSNLLKNLNIEMEKIA